MQQNEAVLGVCRWRDCYSDEHYFATLLATKNLDHETDCEGQTMHVDWSFGGEHPRSYSVRETTSSKYGTPGRCVPECRQLDTCGDQ